MWKRYRAWRQNPDYARLAPLRRIQQSVDVPRFERLSRFLANPTWEATNNGAERMDRTFRHVSAPHFTLRTPTSIDQALKVRACLGKEAATLQAPLPANRSRRGRPRRDLPMRLAA